MGGGGGVGKGMRYDINITRVLSDDALRSA